MFNRFLGASALTLATLSMSGAATAAPVGLGDIVTAAADGPVTAVFVKDGGGFSALLYLVTGSGDIPVFSDAVNVAGNTFDLGDFAAGAELLFKLVTGGQTYFTGPGTRNPDGLAHAYASTADGFTTVGFEDLFGGGDADFDDIVFKFSNTVGSTPSPVPLPAAGALMLAGLGAIGVTRRKRG